MSNPWKCPACFRDGVPEVVQVLYGERYTPEAQWLDSTVRCCPQHDCKHTFGGTVADRLAHIRSIYGYKYFGDYELSPEQSDAIWEAKALAELVPELLVTVRDLLGIIHAVCPEYDDATMCANARAAIARAEGQS